MVEKNLKRVYLEELFTEQSNLINDNLGNLTIELNSSDDEILTIGDLITFSKEFLSDLRTIWNIEDLQTKQRLQQAVFPKRDNLSES